MSDIIINKGVTPYIRGFYWNEEGKYYQLNREEFKSLVKSDELQGFIYKNLEIFYWLEEKTNIKKFSHIFLNDWIEIIVNGILRNDDTKNIYDLIIADKSRITTKKTFLSLKNATLKIVCYLFVALKSSREVFLCFFEKVNVIYKIFLDKPIITKSKTCSQKHEDIFCEKLLFNEDFKPEALLKDLIEHQQKYIALGFSDKRKFLMICIVCCLMLKSACRISSIWRIDVNELKEKQIKFKICKKKDERFVTITNFEFLANICKKENFQQDELRSLFSVKKSIFDTCAISFYTSILSFAKKCFFRMDLATEYKEFFVKILQHSHLARNWTINKMVLKGFTSKEIASLTCQTVDIIETSYVSEVVKDQANKNNKIKIHKYHCELFGLD